MPTKDIFRAKYNAHRNHAKKRGIQFLITFTDWKDIWIKSGKWELRGHKRGQYVMARKGDVGPYKLENVDIITCTQNLKDAMLTTNRLNQSKRLTANNWADPIISKKMLNALKKSQLKAVSARKAMGYIPLPALRKLPISKVRRIKQMYSDGIKSGAIARKFGLNPGTVWQITQGITYTDV